MDAIPCAPRGVQGNSISELEGPKEGGRFLYTFYVHQRQCSWNWNSSAISYRLVSGSGNLFPELVRGGWIICWHSWQLFSRNYPRGNSRWSPNPTTTSKLSITFSGVFSSCDRWDFACSKHYQTPFAKIMELSTLVEAVKIDRQWSSYC